MDPAGWLRFDFVSTTRPSKAVRAMSGGRFDTLLGELRAFDRARAAGAGPPTTSGGVNPRLAERMKKGAKRAGFFGKLGQILQFC